MDLLPPHSSPSPPTALDLVINAADLDKELARDSARPFSRWSLGLIQGGLETAATPGEVLHATLDQRGESGKRSRAR